MHASNVGADDSSTTNDDAARRAFCGFRAGPKCSATSRAPTAAHRCSRSSSTRAAPMAIRRPSRAGRASVRDLERRPSGLTGHVAGARDDGEPWAPSAEHVPARRAPRSPSLAIALPVPGLGPLAVVGLATHLEVAVFRLNSSGCISDKTLRRMEGKRTWPARKAPPRR